MTWASLAALLAGASLSAIRTSLAGTMTATRRPTASGRGVCKFARHGIDHHMAVVVAHHPDGESPSRVE